MIISDRSHGEGIPFDVLMPGDFFMRYGETGDDSYCMKVREIERKYSEPANTLRLGNGKMLHLYKGRRVFKLRAEIVTEDINRGIPREGENGETEWAGFQFAALIPGELFLEPGKEESYCMRIKETELADGRTVNAIHLGTMKLMRMFEDQKVYLVHATLVVESVVEGKEEV